MCVWEKIFYCLGFGLLIVWFCLEWFDGNCGLRLDLVRVGCLWIFWYWIFLVNGFWHLFWIFFMRSIMGIKI